jgi:hypothetical protein
MPAKRPERVIKIKYVDDKYVDAKIKPIKREIQQLKVALSAASKQYAQELLEVQRSIANLKISSDVAVFRSIIESNFPKKGHLFTKLVADAATAKSRLRASKTPNELAANFYKKWLALLKKSGADVAEF